MQPDTAASFDFDDWAGLYLENAQEFEARRQAALMIEMSRGTPEQSAAMHAMLESYENAVRGRSPEERMKIAASLMMDSAHQLSAELQLLKQALETRS